MELFSIRIQRTFQLVSTSLPKLRFINEYSIKTLAFRRKYYTFADEQEPKI